MKILSGCKHCLYADNNVGGVIVSIVYKGGGEFSWYKIFFLFGEILHTVTKEVPDLMVAAHWSKWRREESICPPNTKIPLKNGYILGHALSSGLIVNYMMFNFSPSAKRNNLWIKKSYCPYPPLSPFPIWNSWSCHWLVLPIVHYSFKSVILQPTLRGYEN